MGDLGAHFTGAKPDIVRRHLDILLVMGEVQQNPTVDTTALRRSLSVGR